MRRVAIFLLAAVCGCMSMPEPLPRPPARVVLGPFSFLPLDEPGWVRMPTGSSQWIAGRPGAAQDETVTLQAMLDTNTPPESQGAGLIEFARRSNTPPASGGRFIDSTIDIQPATEIAPNCVRMSLKARDTQPVRASGRTHPMTMVVISYLCGHPRAPQYTLMLGLSERCDPGNESPELEAQALQVAKTLEFLEP